MSTVTDGATVPRDDRAWPQGAFAISVVGSAVAVTGSAALVASAASIGRAFDLLFVFVLVAGITTVAYVDAARPWLRGGDLPPRTRQVQLGLVVLVVLTFFGGLALGGSGLCGYLAGMLLPNASAMRFARLNRGIVDDVETDLAEERPGNPVTTPADAPARQVRARVIPKVGPVLRDTLAVDRDRLLSWVVSTVVVALVCAVAGAAGAAVLGVVLVGAVTVAVVSSRLAGVQRTLRDFEVAATSPRSAYVVLVQDPKPGAYRPLLGIWDEDPVPSGGTLPPPDLLYRCDALQDSLLSSAGALVVHEAWLETGEGGRSRPRWVAADAGVALPYRQGLLDRRSFAALVGAERPARARPLTMAAPNPTTEAQTGTVTSVIDEETRASGRLTRVLLPRFAVAALVGLLLVLLT
jgi:hypothetical protein